MRYALVYHHQWMLNVLKLLSLLSGNSSIFKIKSAFGGYIHFNQIKYSWAFQIAIKYVLLSRSSRSTKYHGNMCCNINICIQIIVNDLSNKWIFKIWFNFKYFHHRRRRYTTIQSGSHTVISFNEFIITMVFFVCLLITFAISNRSWLCHKIYESIDENQEN